MKKISVIFLIIGVLSIGAYFFMRTHLATPGFTPAEAKQPLAETKAPESVVDLRPKLVEKLQQLVKEGSNGLYNLFVREANPDILNSTLGISHAELRPDTAAINELREKNNLPDEIFSIQTDSIWIEGLGLKDALSKKSIDLKTIHILQPTIEVYKNNTKPKSKEGGTVYQRIMSRIKHIGIGKVVIEKGILICHNPQKKKPAQFNDISIRLSNILIDSTTQYDKNRFLFAREAELTLKNYSIPTSNELYTFKVGTISITATKQLLVAKNVELQPHYSKSEFQNHIASQNERYSISIPTIEFRNINWWSLINEDLLAAGSARINTARFNVYLDRRKPADGGLRKSFPHQLLMKLPFRIYVKKMDIGNLNIAYEEFSILSGRVGKLDVNNVHATVSNLTNLPGAIRQNHITTIEATGTLMHVAPAALTIHLDLSRYKEGTFTAELKSSKEFDGQLVNPVAEPLGMFRIKRGELKELSSQISGNNSGGSGTVLVLYNDLHITPLKKSGDASSGIKKKSVTSFIANTFVLKDENPSKSGELRKADASFKRSTGTFFNLIWKTTLVGVLKTIGAPEKLAYQ